ncbi:MAG: sulfatase [Chthonomonadales bacterium]
MLRIGGTKLVMRFGALLALSIGTVVLAIADQPKPNVLFIIADQWRYDAFGFAGNPDVKTPNLDKLAGQSIWLTNAVATVPVCCPTRASLLTGQHALTHGVFMNDVPLDPNAQTYPKVFAKEGYDTAFIGKWHVDGHGRTSYIPPERRQGFQYWKALECTHEYNNSIYYADDPTRRKWGGYDAFSQTEDAIRYIEVRGASKKPFLMTLAWGPPHEPYQTAPEEFRKMYDATKIHLRSNVPAALQQRARMDLAGYYAHCSALDECIGRLMKILDAKGLTKNTIVIFTSDHGDMLYSQGSQKKQQPFEESARVPFLIRYPAKLGSSPKQLPATFATEDVMPTLLKLCNLSPPKSVQGLDFSRYLSGGKDPSDGAASILCPAPFGQWSRAIGGREYRAIRTQQHTYARDLKGPWLLFDNTQDPFQLNNLVGKHEYADLQKKMDSWLNRKLKSRQDTFENAAYYIKKWGYTIDASGTVPIK